MDREIPPEISYEIIAHVFADYLDDYISKHYVVVLFPGSPQRSNDYDQVQAIMFLFWTGGQVRAVIRKLISDTLGIDVDVMTGLRRPLHEQMEKLRACYQFILSDATVEEPYRETEELFHPPPLKFECQETPFCQAYKKFFETVHMFNELQALIYNINEYRPDMSENWLRNFLMLILRARSYLDDDITEVADSFSEIVSCFSSSALKIRLEVKIREIRVAIEGGQRVVVHSAVNLLTWT
ncbi:hypothetical protein BC629DRAFT_1537143 [Irpex lacteus]|nr:hypothetical protein BC629DRAFT_1537143 [Irpex lacteus]